MPSAKRLFVVLVAALFMLVMDTGVSAADSGAVLEAYQAALDKRDLDAAAALFAPDAEVIVEHPRSDNLPVRIAVGQDQVRAWLGALIADDAHLRLEDRPQLQPRSLQGLRVVWLAEFRQRSLRLPVSGSLSALIRDGRIARLSHFFSRQDAAAIESTWMSTARRTEAETQAVVTPGVWAGLLIVLFAGFLIRASRSSPRSTGSTRADGLIAALRKAHHLD
jgi:hypothetical protein